MTAILYVLIILSSVIQSTATKLFNQKSNAGFFFNALKSFFAFSLLIIMGAFKFSFHLPTLVFGFAYGVFLCVSMYSGYRALCLGPMGLSSMLISFSLIIPVIWGIAFRNESLSLLQYLAICLLLAAIVCINLKSKHCDSPKKPLNIPWITFVFVTFAANGICSILQSEHQLRFPSMFEKEFMIVSMLLCTAVYTVISILTISPKELKQTKGKRYGMISGIGMALANLLTLRLAGLENASVLFPVISAGTILSAFICGWILFQEKPKATQTVALAMGIIAIVFLKL